MNVPNDQIKLTPIPIMAASKKKRVEEEMEDEEEVDEEFDENIDEEDEESDENDDQPMEEVQMDFEARIPEDCDFHGMKALLQQLFLKAHIDLGELVNTIISQNYVGSIVKQPYVPEDDEDDDDDDSDDTVLALTTVLNLTEKKELNCVKQIKQMLVERCKNCGKDIQEKFCKLLDNPDQHVGLLLSERFLNLPPNMAVPLFESLIKEMEKARKKNMKYDFVYFLMICKTLQMKGAGTKTDMYFSNSEEELFQEVSELCFTYSVASERDSAVEKWSSEEEMEPLRTVMVVPASKLLDVVEKIKQELATT